MKSIRLLIVATCLGVIAATAHADGGASPPAHDHGKMHGHMHGMMHDRPFLMVVHKLNPTDEQKKQIHEIVRKSDEQTRDAMKQHHELMSGLLNPGDANYANAVQAAKDAAAEQIERRSQDNIAIYNLLTAEQKAKLPQVIADMKQHMMERMKDRQNQSQEPAGHKH